MDKLPSIPGFLPEDYDKEPPGIEDMKLDDFQMYWLKHDQKAKEDGIALGERMAAEYDSYIVLGFKKGKTLENGSFDHESVCGAYNVDKGDGDAIFEMGRLLGYYAFKNIDVYKILDRAIKRCHSFHEEENNPDPPEHKYLPRDQRFHMNRYDRISLEEYEKVRDEFTAAIGNYKLRRDIWMRVVLLAIADQLNDNEDVEIDFFCNFHLDDYSEGDSVSGIKVTDRPYPCTWDEAAKQRDRFEELCKQYDVPCHIVWLKD